LAEFNHLKKENQDLKAIVGALMFQLEKLKKRNEIKKETQSYLQNRQIDCRKTNLSLALNLSRSGCYYRPKQPNRDEELREKILLTLAANPAYGHRRIAIALGVGKKRIRRLMKLYDINPYKRKSRWQKRRDERRPEAVFQNLIKGSFPIVPNVTWVSDFTYLRFNSKFIYLCTFMDLFTREIVGWSLSTRHTKDLVLDAFYDSFQNRGVLPKFVHSD